MIYFNFLLFQLVFICTPKSNHSHDHHLLGDAHYSIDSSRQRSNHVEQDLNQPLVDLDSDSDNDLEEIQFRGFDPASSTNNPSRLETGRNEHDHSGHHHHHVLPGETASIEYILLLVALSVHSIFEGIALGAQKDFTNFMKFLLSIMVHEVLCSFAYGVNLSKQRIPLKKAIGSILFLSTSLPMGLFIMTGVSFGKKTKNLNC